MEPESSLPYSQEPSTGPYPQPDQSSPYHSRFICDYRRGMNWWMDLLSTYTHHSELQVVTAPRLIFTLYKSLHGKSSRACSVFTSRCLVTALSNEDSSASALTSLLSC
jgi:hypothetical protein